ncbi:MAG: Rpn family recombination-promoting nuclease/putative transposase [Okeania sp. SIO2C9]|uniref:Rpn family recombination-promoting nuclease/putative transposase n=1 Tax=Okeania sp. SIO2C9 TaxID=2607791 RepID=UPI0013C145BC|nr:Rpn family recombination-promoting nuclease/putative transposase [Okeania sp. SIO2C9]NEQ73472.1 Rpn family recombination-promoting nuclease/putative transposase [Okeania sp. SIO2C9]
MKTDSIFYELFLTFPESFFELIGIDKQEANNYKFTSREVKQLAFRLDGLFMPNDNNPAKPFYLVEVQFQPRDELYYRIFAELFLYLRQYRPTHPWRVVVIYPSRSIEREEIHQFGDILALERVERIYLDELESDSLGVGIVKLVVEPEETAVDLAKSLVEKSKVQLTDAVRQQNIIELLETIIVYKLPEKSREEITAMFSLGDLKQTRFYRDAFADGEGIGEQRGEQRGEQKAKEEAVTRMLKLGLSLEVIAESLDLPLSVVQQIANSANNN